MYVVYNNTVLALCPHGGNRYNCGEYAIEKEECKGLQHLCKHEKALHINNIKI